LNTQTSPKWEDSAIRFSILVSEIAATVEISDDAYTPLHKSTDLAPGDVDELFGRERIAWQKICASLSYKIT